MRVLFVSSDLHLKVHGVYKRMRMFIDAIKQIAHLDMLFYVFPETDISPAAIAELKNFLSQFWNAKITLFLCPIFKQQIRLSYLQRYITSLFSLFKQPKYGGTTGVQQVQALDECLSRKPDAVFVHRLKSNSQSSAEIFKDLVMAFKPPFRSFFRLWSNSKLRGNKQKLQFTLVMLFVRYTTTWKRVRLQFGGEPKRG